MSKQFYFKEFNLAWIRSLNAKISIVKKTQFSSIQPIDRTLSDATIPGRVDLGVIVMKGYSAFPKAPGFEPQNAMV